MLKKPGECEGCPFYQKGKTFGFVDDDTPSTAQVILCFDMPDGKFTGDEASEQWEARYFRQQFLPFLGLDPWQVGYMNLLRCKHPIGAKGKPLADAKEHCRRHDSIDDNTTLIAVGSQAWKHFSKNVGGSRTDWRSYYVEVPYGDSVGDRDTSGLDELEQFAF